MVYLGVPHLYISKIKKLEIGPEPNRRPKIPFSVLPPCAFISLLIYQFTDITSVLVGFTLAVNVSLSMLSGLSWTCC